MKITICPPSKRFIPRSSIMRINPSRSSAFHRKEKMLEKTVSKIDRRSDSDFIVPDKVNETGRVWSF